VAYFGSSHLVQFGRTDEAPELRALEPGEWTPTRAFGRAVLVVGTLLIAAVFVRRVDLVVLAAPIAIGAALGLWRRPHAAPVVRLDMPANNIGEGSELNASIDIGNDDPVPYDLVVAWVDTVPWLRLQSVNRPYATQIAPGTGVEIALPGHALRWGRHHIGPVVAHAVAADGLLISPVGSHSGVDVKVHPITDPFEASDAMPRAAGMVGFHRSRRPGEGGELAGVRVFSPGDRLRRIDWRVSLRARQLHVAATLSDRDAEIVVLLDVLHESGRSGGVFGRRSVLDLTVRAAAGIADHYLHRGDRVSFLEYGGFSRRLRASSGHRHFLTSLEWLLDVRTRSGMESPPALFGANIMSPNALVIVLTPLIDPRSAAMLARLARSGRTVIAVDTLPAELWDAAGSGTSGDWLSHTAFTPAAVRMVRMERENLIGELREHGVPVVTWTGAGSLDEVLQQVSRMASAPTAVRR
jgi:uncharacterized protein (DUF58 family)